MTNPRRVVVGLALFALTLVTPTDAGAGDEQVPQITKHYVDLSGGQLHYVTAGEGDALLLLHQAPLSHAEFLEIIPLLAGHIRVIAWDAPGHGASYIPPEEYTFLDYLGVLDETAGKSEGPPKPSTRQRLGPHQVVLHHLELVDA